VAPCFRGFLLFVPSLEYFKLCHFLYLNVTNASLKKYKDIDASHFVGSKPLFCYHESPALQKGSVVPKIVTELKAARRAAGMNQDELATRSGLSRKTVNRLETGSIDPRLSTLEVITRALGMEIMLVPATIRADIEAFVQSGGKVIGQPVGVDAPGSIVDEVLKGRKPGKDSA
jgi:DNA-binding XRE family transcriptional regulator